MSRIESDNTVELHRATRDNVDALHTNSTPPHAVPTANFDELVVEVIRVVSAWKRRNARDYIPTGVLLEQIGQFVDAIEAQVNGL